MTRRGRAIVGAIAMLLVVPLVRSGAQPPSTHAAGPPGVIVVQVTDTCLNPLPAEVALPALGFGVRLSEDGTAVLVDVPNGLYLVEVRHAGHASDSRLVRVAGDTARADFALTPIAAERGPAGAPGGGDIARARLHYFIQRSATAMSPGTFITRHQIERRAPRTVSALLGDVRGVRIERAARGRRIVRSTEASEPGCAGGMLVLVDGAPIAPIDDTSPSASAEQNSRAGQAPGRLAADGGGTRSPTLRWVGPSGADLVRVAHNAVRAGETTAVRGAGVTDIDRVKVSSVAALEIYASRGSAPPEVQLPGAECGVVLIWTASA